jgi:CheY-like chemotaxis protein
MWENCNACCGLPLGNLGLSANIGGARLVRILLHFRPVEAVAQSDRQPPHTSGAPIAVLVVEDNDELRSEIADLLTQDGYRVLLAADGLMALDLLRREPAVDVVLLDLWMPVMDGWSFRATQRQEPGIKEVPVVVLTADDSAPARSIDADAFLRKPFEADGLSATVRRIVSERRHGRERGTEQVKKALDLIAGAIGHEVANPLMSIIAWLEQHRQHAGRGSRLDEGIDDVLAQCWRIADSLRTLRALPFPSLDRSRVVHLGPLVRAVLAAPRPEHLRVECTVDENAAVRGDPLVLLYVCTTLLHHSFEAFPRDSRNDDDPEPHVKVALRRMGRDVVLEVIDRGPTIPSDELSQVFSPDYRGRTRGWSAGIRLQYVRQAVETLGGILDIANRTPTGVVCRVFLPVAARSSADPTVDAQSPPPSVK